MLHLLLFVLYKKNTYAYFFIQACIQSLFDLSVLFGRRYIYRKRKSHFQFSKLFT